MHWEVHARCKIRADSGNRANYGRREPAVVGRAGDGEC